MRKFVAILILVIASLPGRAFPQVVVHLWGDRDPAFSKPTDLTEFEKECWGEVCADHIVVPTLTLYVPEHQAHGNVVIVIPGGGYEVVAVYHEGHEIAKALSQRGTAAAVLKYRLPDPAISDQPEKLPISDARRAISLVRQLQDEHGYRATGVGLLGFSAGSHLATWAGLHRDADPALNPDFSMLIYGVTRLTPENRQWLADSLYHRELTDAELVEQTFLKQVSSETPPAFLVHALDDEVCNYRESTEYAEALTRHGVDAEIHLFAGGGHGFGTGRAEDGTDQWLDLAVNWLRRLDPVSSSD